MNFREKISGSFVLSAFLAAGMYLSSCSNTESDTTILTEVDETGTTTADSTSADSSSTSAPGDSTSADSSADSTAADSGITISGFINRGMMAIGTRVILEEVDSTLTPTGKSYRAAVTDTLGSYSISGVNLTQPYVHLEINGRIQDLCYSNNGNGSQVLVEAYADIRKGDTVNLNVLTLMQARLLPKYIKDGLTFNSAMSTLQTKILNLLMLDSLHEDFNKVSLATDQKDNYILLEATLLAEGFIPHSNLEQTLDGYAINDSTFSSAWVAANTLDKGDGCREYLANLETFGYKVNTEPLKDYFKKVWQTKYGLGKCSPENANEIKSVAYKQGYYLYCNSSEWTYPSSCTVLDTIVMNASPNKDTTAGNLTKAPYCFNTYYHWDNSEWKVANKKEVELKRACTAKTEDQYVSSEERCYHCENGTWIFGSTIFCKLDAKSKLLYEESEKKPCGDEEYFRKGVIDTTIYFHCYRGELSYADEFDLAMGRACNADNVGYYKYQNSNYHCNGFIWKYASDSLVTGTVTDKRDSSVYKTVGIGNQVWLAQNLNLAIDSSWCPNDSQQYCDKYGRFYRWDVVLGKNPTVQHICPEGFHVPSNEEWEELIDFATPWFPKKVASLIFASKNAMERSDGIERGEDLVGLSLYMLGSRSLNGAYSGWLFGAHMCSSSYKDTTSYVYKITRDTHEFLPYEQKQNLSCNIRCVKNR